MSVLDEIIVGVREDLAQSRVSLAELNELIDQVGAVRPSLPSLQRPEISLIAEVKRASPSKGALAQISDPAALARIYEKAGASVISVLTEKRRFRGSLADLVSVRNAVSLPVLRKDFMVDEYQFFEARASGADLVLLIVAALSQNQLKDFHSLAIELGMKAIVEVHSEDELERALDISPELIGINSRNLKDLSISRDLFASLLPKIPQSIARIAESGISTREDVVSAEKAGANAILVGEALVREADPTATITALLSDQ